MFTHCRLFTIDNYYSSDLFIGFEHPLLYLNKNRFYNFIIYNLYVQILI